MALNIVHAVEFSRNGRTRVSASRPALRATYLSYHLCCGHLNTRFQPAAEVRPEHTTRTSVSFEVAFHLRLEITESQCDFEAIWLRISPVSAGPLSASRTAVATCKNLRGSPRSRQIRAASRACRARGRGRVRRRRGPRRQPEAPFSSGFRRTPRDPLAGMRAASAGPTRRVSAPRRGGSSRAPRARAR